MNSISTFARLGIPDALATTVALVLLSLALAPWLGGAEIGPLKVPVLNDKVKRRLAYGAPVCLILFVCGFLKLWPTKTPEAGPTTYGAFMRRFEGAGATYQDDRPFVSGQVFPMKEFEARFLAKELGGTRWDGGEHWGEVQFDAAGRVAS